MSGNQVFGRSIVSSPNMEVTANRKENWDDVIAAGDFQFLADQDGNENAGIRYMCPCGCGTISALNIQLGPNKPGRYWGWNGSLDKPTLTPSIQRLDDCHWHGYLDTGIWRSC